jgi:formate-dependent nitrite reductase membrane component NrfD
MSPVLQPLPEVPWGLSIGLYFILAGVAAGTTLVAEWVEPQDNHTAVAFTWKTSWVAMVALALCGVLLVVDLGRPARFFLMLTRFSTLGSAMSVGAKLIALKGFLLALYLYLLHRRRHALATGDVTLAPGVTRATYTVVPALLAVASLCLAAYPAVLLARTWFAPLAASSGAALLFVTTALLMGTAVATGAAPDETLGARLRGVMLFLGAAQLCLLLLAGLALYGGSPVLERALGALIVGRAAAVFWVLVVGVGLGVPLVALAAMRQQRLVTIASALCLFVGAATLRFLLFTVA